MYILQPSFFRHHLVDTLSEGLNNISPVKKINKVSEYFPSLYGLP